MENGGHQDVGADHEVPRAGCQGGKRVHRNGAGLARHWLALWISTCCFPSECASVAELSRAYQQTGRAGGAAQVWDPNSAAQVQSCATGASMCLPTSQRKSVWGSQSISEGCMVSGLSCPMEGGNCSESISTAISAGIIDFEEPRNPVINAGDSIAQVKCLSDRGGHEVQVRAPCNKAASEEGRRNEGTSFLQVPRSCLRILRVGPSGDGVAEEVPPEGARGEPRDEPYERGDGDGQEGAVDTRGLTEGKGRLCADDAAVLARRGKELSWHGGGAGRTEAPGSDGKPADAAPESVGTASEPAVLADSTCRGEPSRRSDERPREESRGDEAGCRAETKDDDWSSDGGSSSRMSGASSGWRCGDPRGEGTRTAVPDLAAQTKMPSGGAVPECRCGDPGGEGTRTAVSRSAALGHRCGDGGGGRTQTASPLKSTEGTPWHLWQKDLSQDKMKEMLKDAPCAVKIQGRNMWSTATKLQLQEEAKEEEERLVQPMYWLKCHHGWKFHQGILPNFDREGEAVLAVSEPQGLEAEEEPWGVIKKGLRKRMQRSMKELTVSEVYSEPRLTETAKALGMQGGTSFDLKTGFDLSLRKDRKRCWRQLQKEDPDLIIICPPCGPFSCLQNLNYDKMETGKAMAMLGEGLQHLEFSMKVYEWQVRRGRKAIFEHPAKSKAWEEECVQRVLKLEGVQRVRGDQCSFGLQVDASGELSKKPTDFMVNGPHMAKRLGVRCSGDHPHAPLMNGIAKKAEKYPKKLCEAMIKGFKEDVGESGSVVLAFDLEDALDQEVEREETEHPAQEPEILRGEAEAEEEEEDEEDEPLPRGVSDADKRKIRKLHNNLGHPSKESFLRALRVARARPEVIKHVKERFRCEVCEAHTLPKAARPSMLPKHFEPGKIIGIDVVFMPSHNPRITIPVLNIIDWATCYQSLEPLEGRLSETIWKGFMRSWVRVFGMPELVVCDQGREFMSSFCRKVNEGGAIVRTIGARAPWQQGRTERHGGLAKGMLKRVVDQVSPTSYEEWVTCVYEVESAKNRMFNRSGFSPTQRQIGMNVRIPGSLASDDQFDVVTQRSTASSDLQRLMSIREAAQEAFLKHSTQEAVKRAEQARPRIMRDFHPGEAVFVYRKPLPRKGGGQDGRVAQWCGPGTVVLQEGPNVWIAMRGEMWKCAKEQVRSATPEEEEAYGLLKDEFKELQMELGRKGSKRGFKDISGWELPPQGQTEEEEEQTENGERPSQRPRLDHGPHSEDGLPMGQGSQAGIDSSSSSSSISNAGEETAPTAASAPTIPQDVLDRATQSVMRNERLDGTPSQGFNPTRSKLESIRFSPYGGSLWTINEEELEEQTLPDQWIYLEETRSLIRLHHVERRGGSCPQDKRGCPLPVKFLYPKAKVYRQFLDGRQELEEVNWRTQRHGEGPRRNWTGFTEFKVKSKVAESKVQEVLAANKGSDEVKESDIKPEEWPLWRVADGEEWSKVEASGAVKALSIEESQEVERQLREAGSIDRVLPSTVVRRWKPAELPGEPPTMKSRWCIRGDKDPDLLSLDRYSPTVTTAVISIVLQTACSRHFRTAVGDLKNAFMQSERLVRPKGRLFCRQPRGGLPGMSPSQIIEILAGAYGLGDAPLHWRKSLLKVLHELGYRQSSMDPCTFRLFHEGRLRGMIVVEVDDLLTMGDEFHFSKMEELQHRFHFGKFKFLDEEEKGVSFNGRRLRVTKDGTYLIDMQKFIEERLKEVPLQVGRAGQKDQDATEEERAGARAVIGALTWAAKEGRPDCSAAASIIAGTLNKMKVQDIVDLNKAVREAKKDSCMCLRIQPINPNEMVWGVITDASYANAQGSSSQGAFGVICAEERVLREGEGRMNLLHWRSGKMHRVVNSTLAAESQSLSKGLGELSWSVTVYKDLTTEHFDLKEWQSALRDQRMMSLNRVDCDETLKQSLCVVDAKSLFDHLVKETVGCTDDKRTAIEMQVIRQSMQETNATIKWVPHPKMFMDCLTKRSGNRSPLLKLLDSGKFSLHDDEVNKDLCVSVKPALHCCDLFEHVDLMA